MVVPNHRKCSISACSDFCMKVLSRPGSHTVLIKVSHSTCLGKGDGYELAVFLQLTFFG